MTTGTAFTLRWAVSDGELRQVWADRAAPSTPALAAPAPAPAAAPLTADARGRAPWGRLTMLAAAGLHT